MTGQTPPPSCDLCHASLEGKEDTVGLEVTRGEHYYHDVAFCDQEHAAQWLAQPLPPTDEVMDGDGWLLPAAALSVIAFLLAMMVLGLYSFGRLVLGWL